MEGIGNSAPFTLLWLCLYKVVHPMRTSCIPHVHLMRTSCAPHFGQMLGPWSKTIKRGAYIKHAALKIGPQSKHDEPLSPI